MPGDSSAGRRRTRISKTDPDALAYPLVEKLSTPGTHLGLTKREYFAAAALTGMLAAVRSADADLPAVAGGTAVQFADALIAALNARKEADTETVET